MLSKKKLFEPNKINYSFSISGILCEVSSCCRLGIALDISRNERIYLSDF